MAKKIKTMHLVKQKDIIETTINPFADIKEGSIDPDNFIINGVCLFGTRESQNNRIYQDKAIQSIADLSEGAKCYLNHITKSEQKDRSGARNLSDWVGVFEGSYKKDDAVFSNLKVREVYFDLVKDIAIMQPPGIGHSIDARVKVFTGEDQKEQIVDVDSLRSTDLVSDGATIQNLWESLENKVDENKEENWLNDELVELRIEDQFEVIMAKEGLIQDKLNDDKIKQGIQDITWTANDFIRDVMADGDLKINDKKGKIISIFDDLSKEIKKRIKDIKMEGKEKEMDITLEMLRKDHPELIETILKESTDKLNVTVMKEAIKDFETKIESLEKQIVKKDEEIEEDKETIKTLESKNKKIEIELDKISVSGKLAEKEVMIANLISEAKLLDESVTDIFKETLMAVQEKKDGEDVVTVEEQVKQLIEDRKSISAVKSTVKNSGDEFVEGVNKDKSEKKMDRKEVEEGVEDFLFDADGGS